MERKKLERVKSASSEPGLNFLGRKSTWAVHSCDSVPQLLDGIQFEFIDRTREKSSDVKKLLIPDCKGKLGLVHEEMDGANLPHCDR
jgi:hypothetical protein